MDQCRMKETDHPHIKVDFNGEVITVRFRSNDEEDWDKEIKWADIVRVCYKTYDYGAPDFLYIHTDDGHDAEAIVPVTDTGGDVLWKEIQERKFFDWSKIKNWDKRENSINCYPERK